MKNKQYFGLSSQLIKRIFKAIESIASDTPGLAIWVESILYNQMIFEQVTPESLMGVLEEADIETLVEQDDTIKKIKKRAEYAENLRELTDALDRRGYFESNEHDTVKDVTELYIDDIVLKKGEQGYKYHYFLEGSWQLGFTIPLVKARDYLHSAMKLLEPLLNDPKFFFCVSSKYRYDHDGHTDYLEITKQEHFRRKGMAQLVIIPSGHHSVNPELVRKGSYHLNIGSGLSEVRFCCLTARDERKDLLKISTESVGPNCLVAYSILA